MGRIGILSGLKRRSAPANPGGSNEPEGFTPALSQTFTSKTLGSGWSYQGTWNSTWPDGTTERVEIVNDGTAPNSPATFLRFNWPEGGEQEPSSADKGLGASYSEIYLSVYFRHSANWENNPTATNKIFYLGTSNAPTYDGEIFFDFHNSEYVSFRCQQPEPDSPARPPNINTNPCTPGTWYHLEAHLVGNTGSTDNGSVRWWIDGVEQGFYDNVLYDETGDGTFDALNIAPVWGGGGNTTRAIYLDFHSFYISGLL